MTEESGPVWRSASGRMSTIDALDEDVDEDCVDDDPNS